jgi:hypothetical protein
LFKSGYESAKENKAKEISIKLWRATQKTDMIKLKEKSFE